MDDTRFPKERKIPLLNDFYKKLRQRGWNFNECGEGNERYLLSNLDRMIKCHLELKQSFREIIEDITRRMGKGMSEFIEKEVVSIVDWDLYCHYVAGLVGIGLSRLFAESGLEDSQFKHMDHLSNSMGLCLQKTNIIRDYLEDINQHRIFWPREVWSKYANSLECFKQEDYSKNAVYCLNELITNALQHLPDCIEYMSRLRDKHIFDFCAIPQIMAVATLALCYQNHDVFTSVVKMKREETMEIIGEMNGMQSVYLRFYQYVNIIASKVIISDPNAAKTIEAITNIRSIIEARTRQRSKL